MNLRYVLYCIALIWGTAVFSASSTQIEVDIHSSSLTPTIGDSLTVFCDVIVPEGFLAGEPYIQGVPSQYELERQWSTTGTPGDGTVRELYGFLAYVLSPDTLTVGPLYVDYTTAEGDTGTAVSNTLILVVNGVIDNPDADPPPEPKPNRSPLAISKRGFSLWLIGIIAAVTALFGYFLYRKMLKRAAVIKPSPSEIIDELTEFEKIRKLRLHEKGEIRELYIRVSDAMRAFLHRNMEFDALYETSEEILSNLSGDTVDRETFDRLREIMSESDMVKFAKFHPHEDLSNTVIDRAVIPVKTILDKRERERKRREAEQAISKEETGGEGDMTVTTTGTGGER